MRFSIDDILGFLVADTLCPSTFGSQLERLQFGLISTPDPYRAREDAEARMLEQAELIRCVDEFRLVKEFHPPSKALQYRTLEKIQKASQLPQGHIAASVLRAYQHWGNSRAQRALVAVFDTVRSMAPRVCPTLTTDTMEAVQMFREGKAKRSHDLAANAYADSLLALGGHLKKRDRRG